MNVYLIEDDGGGVTVFDAGIKGMGPAIAAAATALGGLNRVVLGHSHVDHRGAAPELRAPVFCHADDRAQAEGDGGLHYVDYDKLRAYARPFYRRILHVWDGGPVTVAGTIAEGDDVSGFRAVHIPGHSPGMIALYRERDGLMLASDLVYTLGASLALERHRTGEATALAERADRQDAHVPVDAGDVLPVVGVRADEPRDRGAVPARVPDLAILEVRRRGFLGGDPVARIGRIRVASVAVVGDDRIVDEVVAGQDAAGEVGVRKDAGVDDRDDDRARAGRDVPRGLRVDRGVRVREVPARIRIVGRARGPAPLVGHRELRVPVRDGRQRRRLRIGAGRELDDVRAERHAAQEPRLGAELAAETLDARLRRERGLDVGVVELDDETGTRERGPGGEEDERERAARG